MFRLAKRIGRFVWGEYLYRVARPEYYANLRTHTNNGKGQHPGRCPSKPSEYFPYPDVGRTVARRGAQLRVANYARTAAVATRGLAGLAGSGATLCCPEMAELAHALDALFDDERVAMWGELGVVDGGPLTGDRGEDREGDERVVELEVALIRSEKDYHDLETALTDSRKETDGVRVVADEQGAANAALTTALAQARMGSEGMEIAMELDSEDSVAELVALRAEHAAEMKAEADVSEARFAGLFRVLHTSRVLSAGWGTADEEGLMDLLNALNVSLDEIDDGVVVDGAAADSLVSMLATNEGLSESLAEARGEAESLGAALDAERVRWRGSEVARSGLVETVAELRTSLEAAKGEWRSMERTLSETRAELFSSERQCDTYWEGLEYYVNPVNWVRSVRKHAGHITLEFSRILKKPEDGFTVAALALAEPGERPGIREGDGAAADVQGGFAKADCDCLGGRVQRAAHEVTGGAKETGKVGAS